MGKGKLITVQLGPKHFVKMYEADAVAQGLVPGQAKARPQPANKMQPAGFDKYARPGVVFTDEQKAAIKGMSADMTPDAQPLPAADDLTTIPGIGLGVARSLAARGITTFAALRAATDLSFVSKKAQAAIDTWKNA